MASDDHPISVDPAMRRPLGDIAAAGAERFTQGRVERILRVVVALGCAVLGVQGFLNALGSAQELPAWNIALIIAVFLPLALMIVALAAGVAARAFSGVFAVVFLLALTCWPAATTGIDADPADQPWIWYLLNVATVAAVMAFRMPLQIAWAVLIPALYAVVRLGQVGGTAEATVSVVLDAAFATILAGVIVALGWMLRSAARGIDAARRAAVDSYAHAAAVDAAETERVAVAALMHDSVLAALIAAERAATEREEALAVVMAREALTRLANAEQDPREGSDAPVAPSVVVVSVERAAAELGFDLAVAADVSGSAPAIPGRVARALALAATQAVANALQHAGGAGLVVTAHADAAAIGMRITDGGGGFDPASVPADRLGIRGSIVARMAAVGGHARIETGPDGTTVDLEWELPS